MGGKTTRAVEPGGGFATAPDASEKNVLRKALRFVHEGTKRGFPSLENPKNPGMVDHMMACGNRGWRVLMDNHYRGPLENPLPNRVLGMKWFPIVR
jgi:hypothetical protein